MNAYGPHQLYTKVIDPTSSTNKIAILGAGQVGVACGVVLLLRKVTTHIVFFEKNQEKIDVQIQGIQPYAAYFNNGIVEGTCNDFSKLIDTRICILAAGGKILPGENKMDVLQKNVDIVRAFVPHILKYCPDCILIIVTNPIDIISYFAWKMTKFPASRVLGVGHLYSKPFQYEIAQHLKLDHKIVSGWIVGEYGDSGVTLWSGVNVAATRIQDLYPHFGTATDEDKSLEVQKDLLNLPHKITILKGSSTWSPAFCVAAIAKTILCNKNEIFSVSVLAKGICTIEKNIFLSLPCEIGRNGVVRCVIPKLNEDELKRFEKSADVVDKKIKKCTFWTVNSPTV